MPDVSELQNEVHLWFLPTTRFTNSELAADVLSLEEQRRAARFAFEKDRRSYITAHWLVRNALSHYLPVSPVDWEFEPTLLGKPSISQPAAGRSLKFNLSHSTGMVACAVSSVGEVGVDVETVRTREYLNVAQRFFAPEEFSQLEPLSAIEQTDAFFRFWTLKEAYIKARGLGLSADLAGFCFPNILGEEITIKFADDFVDCPSEWCFFRHEPDAEHKIAVAVQRPPGVEVRLRIFPDILNDQIPMNHEET